MRDGDGRFRPGCDPGPGRPAGLLEAKPRRLPRIAPARSLVRVQWAKLDGRSAPARALIAKVLAHREQLGGEVSVREAVLIDKLGKLELVSEILEARLLVKVCGGGSPSDAELAQWLGLLDRISRLCLALGLRQTEARQPRSLEDWLKGAQAAQVASEDEGRTDHPAGQEIARPEPAQQAEP